MPVTRMAVAQGAVIVILDVLGEPIPHPYGNLLCELDLRPRPMSAHIRSTGIRTHDLTLMRGFGNLSLGALFYSSSLRTFISS
jgi:hypothetical protein